MIAPRILIITTALLIAGCGGIPNREALKPTYEEVDSRTNLPTDWGDSFSTASHSERVNQLLRSDLNVETAVQIAVLNNGTLRGTFQQIGVSQAEVLKAARIANPTLSASVRWPNAKPRGPDSEFSFAADLLDGLLIPLKKNFARAQLRQVQKRVANEVLSLITEVKIAFYTLEAHQMLRDRLAAILSVNKASADLSNRQFEAGNISHLDLLNQQVPSQETFLLLAQADAEIRSDREVINRLLGLWGQQTNWKTDQVLTAPKADSLFDKNFESLALRQRLDLEIAREQADLTRSALKLKSSTRLLPASVSVGVDTEREAPGDRLTGPSLELSLPIFSQGQPEVALLSAEYISAETAFSTLAVNIRSEVREKRDQLIAAASAVDYYQKTLLPQRRAILQETLLHYNAMQRSSYELLAAKEQELMSERESLEALRHYWIARAEFEQALGGKIDFAPVMESGADQPSKP